MSLDSDFEYGNNLEEKQEADIQRQVLNDYKKSYTALALLFAGLYAKYEVDGKLTYVEMARYNRLKVMIGGIRTEINGLYAKNGKILRKGLTDVYKSSYYTTAYALEKEIQARLRYTLLTADKIATALQNPVSGLTLNQTLLKNKADIITKISQEVTRGLVNGDSYGKMAKSIKDTLGGDAVKAKRVVATEAHRIQNEARFESMKHALDMGVNIRKRWEAVLDAKTRDAHQSLDGKELPMDEEFVSDNGGRGLMPGEMGEPSDNINCRCQLGRIIDGIKPDVRWVRGEGVVPYKTYKEWANAKGV